MERIYFFPTLERGIDINMKKIQLFLVSLFCMLVLSACGAEITTTTNINKDGSGELIVTAVASSSEAEYLNGGFDALNQLLLDKAPEGLELSVVYDETNSDYTYSYKIAFKDSNDYNNKIATLFGTQGLAEFTDTSDYFTHKIIYKDLTDKALFIGWALNAIDESGICSYDSSEIYSWGYRYLNYDGEEVYSGYQEPTMEKTTTVGVSKVKCFSEYDINSNARKTLEIYLNTEDLVGIKEDDILSYFKKFDQNVEYNATTGTITYRLDNLEKINQFLLSVMNSDGENDVSEPPVKLSVTDSSIFAFSYELEEYYNLGNLFKALRMDTDYIDVYLSVPENLNYDWYDFTSYQAASEVADAKYNYQGACYYDSSFSSNFEAEQSVMVKDIDVKCILEDDMSGKLTTEFSFLPNGCDIDEAKCKEFYKDLDQEIAYQEQGDAVVVTFTKKFDKGESYSDKSNVLQVKESSLSNRKTKVYTFDHVFMLSGLVPMDDCEVNYKIMVPDSLKVTYYHSNEKVLTGKETERIQKNGYYTESISTYGGTVSVSVAIEKANVLFYVIVVVIVVALVGAAGVIIFLFLRKNKARKVGMVKSVTSMETVSSEEIATSKETTNPQAEAKENE